MGRKIILLGSTGSIGTQTLDVVRNNADLEVIGLAANRNVELIEHQIRQFRPKFAAMFDPAAAADLRTKVSDLPVKVYEGMDGLL